MTGFVQNMDGLFQVSKVSLDVYTGFVLNKTGCDLNITGFVLILTKFVLKLLDFS